MSGDRDLARRLAALRAPDEAEAEARAWPVVREAYRERVPVRPAPRVRRLALLAGGAAAALAIGLSPAGAKVGDLVRDVVGAAQPDTKPVLRSLPAPGALLIETQDGPWIVRDDGLKRHLGDYQSATWSPRGRYVAAASAHELFALEPDGDLRWSLSHPARLHDPAWSHSGFRIAYLAGDSLRVVAGDGTGDQLLDRSVLARAPAWRPPAEGALDASPSGIGTHQVAYVDRISPPREGELIRLVDADSGRTLWTRRADSYVTELEWSRNGERLLVTTAAGYEIYSRGGEAVAGNRGAQNDAAISPDGTQVALSYQRKGRGAEVFVRDAGAEGPLRKVFSGPGVLSQLEWSPNGRWLLVAWPTADQLLFLRDQGDRVISVGRIKEQFQLSTGFPEVAGWCCAAGPE
jgi:hypothetical protein